MFLSHQFLRTSRCAFQRIRNNRHSNFCYDFTTSTREFLFSIDYVFLSGSAVIFRKTVFQKALETQKARHIKDVKLKLYCSSLVAFGKL